MFSAVSIKAGVKVVWYVICALNGRKLALDCPEMLPSGNCMVRKKAIALVTAADVLVAGITELSLE
jgi:hypothetical protein